MTQLCLWSQKPSPHTCWLSTARMLKNSHKKKICPHGGSHFSKRRSESENYNRYQRDNSKNDTQSENDDTKVKSEEKLETTIKTVEAKIIARDDEVKAIEKTLEEFRARKEKQIDRKIETKASITLPHPFATTFHIFILTFNILCLFPIFLIAIHLYQFTIYSHLETSVIAKHFIHDRQTQPKQKATAKALASTDSIRPFKFPEKPPDSHHRNLPWNLLVPKYLLSGQIRKSGNDPYHHLLIFNYLDSSR